jgi:hypothetical protein
VPLDSYGRPKAGLARASSVSSCLRVNPLTPRPPPL